MSITDIPGVQKKDMWKVPFKSLSVITGFNIRTPAQYGDIEELAHQILKNGTSPMEVMTQGNKVIVKDGHRRHRAITWAAEQGLLDLNHVYIDCYEEAANTTEPQRIIDMLLHASHEPLTVLDEAAAYMKLTIFGTTPSDIAEMVGKKTAYISGRLRLLDAPEAVKHEIISGNLSPTAALALIKLPPQDQQRTVAEHPGGMKVADVQRVTKKKGGNISRKYINDLYDTVSANYETQSDAKERHIIQCIQAGIRLCKEDGLDLQQVIEELK